jgi:hypothetical protein
MSNLTDLAVAHPRYRLRVVKEFKAVPLPDDVIQAGDVLALAGSVLDLARFVGNHS